MISDGPPVEEPRPEQSKFGSKIEDPHKNPLAYPEKASFWPGEPPLIEGCTRLYRGEDTVTGLGPAPDWGTNPELVRKTQVEGRIRFFTESRFDAEWFASMLGEQDRQAHVVYVDVPTEQVRKWVTGKKDTAEFPEVLVPVDIAEKRISVPPLPKDWRSWVYDNQKKQWVKIT